MEGQGRDNGSRTSGQDTADSRAAGHGSGTDNPVGVRYVAYVQIGTGEYAIHGTAWPNWVKLRAAVSLGCIRMLNSDVIQVYNRIKVGTPVVVTN
jgi:lipoprotein-anchoring transpeptidase ErfK/SrfK